MIYLKIINIYKHLYTVILNGYIYCCKLVAKISNFYHWLLKWYIGNYISKICKNMVFFLARKIVWLNFDLHPAPVLGPQSVWAGRDLCCKVGHCFYGSSYLHVVTSNSIQVVLTTFSNLDPHGNVRKISVFMENFMNFPGNIPI